MVPGARGFSQDACGWQKPHTQMKMTSAPNAFYSSSPGMAEVKASLGCCKMRVALHMGVRVCDSLLQEPRASCHMWESTMQKEVTICLCQSLMRQNLFPGGSRTLLISSGWENTCVSSSRDKVEKVSVGHLSFLWEKGSARKRIGRDTGVEQKSSGVSSVVLGLVSTCEGQFFSHFIFSTIIHQVPANRPNHSTSLSVSVLA